VSPKGETIGVATSGEMERTMQFLGWTGGSKDSTGAMSGGLDRVTTLRGIAALMVAVGHSLLVFSVDNLPTLRTVPFAEVPGVESLVIKALLVLFNGNSAVTLFFVISGFVLGLSLDRGKGGFISNYMGFVLRRVFRIYPALIVSLLLVGALMPWIVSLDESVLGSEWFNSLYRTPFEIADLWNNVLLVSTDMNPISWTLRIELVAALFLPLLHVFTRKTGPWYDVVMLVGLVWISSEYTRADSLKWIVAFYFGIILPRWGGWIECLARTSPMGGSASILVAIATFLTATPFWGINLRDTTGIVYEAASASVVIACFVYGKELQWCHWIDLRWLRLVGRVSYSFYLIHLVVLYCLARAIIQIPGTWVAGIPPLVLNVLLAGLSISAAIVLARYLFLWVETPFMLLGKQISLRLVQLGSLARLCRSEDDWYRHAKNTPST
jgi:peptidoglycan/LPS O-acetylase OafA/YrhL